MDRGWRTESQGWGTPLPHVTRPHAGVTWLGLLIMQSPGSRRRRCFCKGLCQPVEGPSDPLPVALQESQELHSWGASPPFLSFVDPPGAAESPQAALNSGYPHPTNLQGERASSWGQGRTHPPGSAWGRPVSPSSWRLSLTLDLHHWTLPHLGRASPSGDCPLCVS